MKKVLTSLCAIAISVSMIVSNPFDALAVSHHTEKFKTGNAKFDCWLIWSDSDRWDGTAVFVDAKTKDKTYTITFANTELNGDFVLGGSFYDKKECTKTNKTAIATGGGYGTYTIRTKHWLTNRAKAGWSQSIACWKSPNKVGMFSSYN